MNILAIENLKTYFKAEDRIVHAVDDICLRLVGGRTLGLVGESGSGKTATALSIVRLLARNGYIAGGKVSFMGKNLVKLSEPEMRSVRGKEIAIKFQDSGSAVNPVYKVGSHLMDAIALHLRVSKKAARRRAFKLLQEVGFSASTRFFHSYPSQLSGGEKQRILIALALSCNPKFMIADELTTGLDMMAQARTIRLLRKLRDGRQLSMLFISHDLAVVAEIADDVAVMSDGKIVEYASVADLFTRPQHPYTKGLLACRPRLDSNVQRLPTIQDFQTEDQIDKVVSGKNAASNISFERAQSLTAQNQISIGGGGPEDFGDKIRAENIVSVKNLRVYFPYRRGLLFWNTGYVKAVDDVSFSIRRGQTLGVVGESGSGKTTMARAILRLIEPTSGKITFAGHDLLLINEGSLRKLRRRMQIIFQNPLGSMNPTMTVEAILREPMLVHRIGSSHNDRRDRAASLLEDVGLDAVHLNRFPSELSGGQRQRVCIARALTVSPEFLICDEIVSMLDVSVQAQVLNLLKDLQEKYQLTYMFISHDLSVVKFMADVLLVMQEGKIIEFAPAVAVCTNPKQDYTKQLIAATPKVDIDEIKKQQQQRHLHLVGDEKTTCD